MGWTVAAAVALGLAVAEVGARRLTRVRVAVLVRRVVEASPDLAVTLREAPVLPRLTLGRVVTVEVRCASATLPGLHVTDVHMHLEGIRVDPLLRVTAGTGWLEADIGAQEVLRMAGVRGTSLELTEGMATVRWPGGRLPLPRVGLRLRPSLEGRRIRLHPTPLSIALPPLPDGVEVETVAVTADALHVGAHMDLPRVLQPAERR